MRLRLMIVLSLRQWKMRRRTMLLTLFCLLLSVILLTILMGLSAGVISLIRRDAEQSVGTYHYAFTCLEPAGLERVAKDFQNDAFFSSVTLTERDGQPVLELTVRHPSPWMGFGLERRLEAYGLTEIGASHNTALLAVSGALMDDQFIFLVILLGFPFALTVLCAALILDSAFRLSGVAREREFGLLCCAGASGRQLSALVFMESGLYWVLSLPFGIWAGTRILYAIEPPIRAGLLSGDVFYETVFPPAAGLFTGLGAALILWLACRRAARRVQRLRPISAIRQTAGIKPKRREIEVPTYEGQHGGIVELLARQNRRRFRRRTRPSLILLTVCIVLCVALDGFRLAIREETGFMSPEGRDLVLAFGGGVTGFLALIGGLGLLLTVYGQMAEQRQELCLLRSAGLSIGDLRQMLLLEAVMRTIPALLWGIAAGALLSVLLHDMMQTSTVNFPYAPPMIGIGLAVLIAAAQGLLSTAVALREQRKTGIIEGLRREAA